MGVVVAPHQHHSLTILHHCTRLNTELHRSSHNVVVVEYVLNVPLWKGKRKATDFYPILSWTWRNYFLKRSLTSILMFNPLEIVSWLFFSTSNVGRWWTWAGPPSTDLINLSLIFVPVCSIIFPLPDGAFLLFVILWSYFCLLKLFLSRCLQLNVPRTNIHPIFLDQELLIIFRDLDDASSWKSLPFINEADIFLGFVYLWGENL